MLRFAFCILFSSIVRVAANSPPVAIPESVSVSILHHHKAMQMPRQKMNIISIFEIVRGKLIQRKIIKYY